MFQSLKSAARRFFQGFLRGLRKTGSGTVKVLEAVADANDSAIVRQVEAAESRIESRGTFGNVVGILFDDPTVKSDIATVRERKAYADSVKARRVRGNAFTTMGAEAFTSTI